jgi:hypothetical protein
MSGVEILMTEIPFDLFLHAARVIHRLELNFMQQNKFITEM